MHPRRVFAISALIGLAFGAIVGAIWTGRDWEPAPEENPPDPLPLYRGDFTSDAARIHYLQELWGRGVQAEPAPGSRP